MENERNGGQRHWIILTALVKSILFLAGMIMLAMLATIAGDCAPRAQNCGNTLRIAGLTMVCLGVIGSIIILVKSLKR